MLRRVGVAHLDHLVRRVQHDDTAVLDRERGCLPARQRSELSLHFPGDLLGQPARRSEQDGLGVGPVLGLRQQVGGHECRNGRRIGHDEHFGRPGRHIDRNGRRGDLLLGSRDVLVARSENLVYARDALRAVSHRSDRLRAACLEYVPDAGDRCRIQHGGGYASVFLRRGAQHDLFAAGYAAGTASISTVENNGADPPGT